MLPQQLYPYFQQYKWKCHSFVITHANSMTTHPLNLQTNLKHKYQHPPATQENCVGFWSAINELSSKLKGTTL